MFSGVGGAGDIVASPVWQVPLVFDVLLVYFDFLYCRPHVSNCRVFVPACSLFFNPAVAVGEATRN